MSGSVLLEMQGVLRSDNGKPVAEGITLYASLAAFHRIVLVGEDADTDSRWLKLNGLDDHAQLLIGSMDVALRHARGQLALDIRLLVSPSPATVAAAMHLGVTSLLFAHPRFARPEFRNDVEREPREWDAIVAEMDAQTNASVRVPQYEDDSV